MQVGGSATRRGCWVAALSWAACGQGEQANWPGTAEDGYLALACGSSDGSVTLFGQSAPFLGSLPPLKPYDAHAPGSSATRALLPLACIAPPDMRGVTCLHMRCITTPQGEATADILVSTYRMVLSPLVMVPSPATGYKALPGYIGVACRDKSCWADVSHVLNVISPQCPVLPHAAIQI